jgi:FkbM family methyltransferase
MMAHPTPDPVTEAAQTAALRAVFRTADKATRQHLVPVLPPAEVEFAGVRMYVDPRDNYTDRMLWLHGQPPEMASLMALVERIEGRRALVLDIGANCGAFTVPLAVAAGQGSRVIAFEPNPVMIGRLGHNVRLNGLGDVVRIEGCALGAEAGEAMLNFRQRNFGQASLMPVRRAVRDGGTLVPVRPLTDFTDPAAVAGFEVSVLKIDVEGGEEAALAPLLTAAEADGWLPDFLLMETRHADEWDGDLLGRVKTLGFDAVLEADGNTLLARSGRGGTD